MKRWLVWLMGVFALALSSPLLRAGGDFDLQCKKAITVGDQIKILAKADAVSTSPTYMWTVSNPALGSLPGTGKPETTLTALAPGKIRVSCTHANQKTGWEEIEILPVPDATITAPQWLTRGMEAQASVLNQPGCRFEWLPVAGIKIKGGNTSHVLKFDVEGWQIDKVNLSVQITSGSGKVIKGNFSCSLDDRPNAVFSIGNSVKNKVTVGSPNTILAQPLQSKFVFEWFINQKPVEKAGSSLQLSAKQIGIQRIKCTATNKAGLRDEFELDFDVIPEPNTEFYLPSEGKFGTIERAFINPQPGVSYFWEVTHSYGNGLLLSGQGTNAIQFQATEDQGCQITLHATNAAGTVRSKQKSYTTRRPEGANNWLAISPSCMGGMQKGRAYTLSGLPAQKAHYQWKITRTIHGQIVVKEKETDVPVWEITADGDLYTTFKAMCTLIPEKGTPQTWWWERLIIESPDATSFVPDKVTKNVWFNVKLENPNHYYANWEFFNKNGKKIGYATSYSDKPGDVVLGDAPGEVIVKCYAKAGMPHNYDDPNIQQKTITLLPELKFDDFFPMGLLKNWSYGMIKDGQLAQAYYITRGASASLMAVFSGGQPAELKVNDSPKVWPGDLRRGGEVLTSEYSTHPIEEETTFELTVKNEAGHSVRKSLTLIPVDPALDIRFITINQAVERYLDPEHQEKGTFNNSTFPQDFWQSLNWKKDVPLIAGRPARFTVHVLGQNAIAFGKDANAKNRIQLVLDNNGQESRFDMVQSGFTCPTVGTSFGESNPAKVLHFDVTDPSLLTEATQLRIETSLDPSLGVDPLYGVINPYRENKPVGFKAIPLAKRPRFIFVPINVAVWTSNTPWTDSEIDRAVQNARLSIQSLFPISTEGFSSYLTAPLDIRIAGPYGMGELPREVLSNGLFRQIKGEGSLPNDHFIGLVKPGTGGEPSVLGSGFTGCTDAAFCSGWMSAIYFNGSNKPYQFSEMDEQKTVPHELMHNYGLKHAPYAYGQYIGVDPYFPNLKSVSWSWYKRLNGVNSPYFEGMSGMNGFSIYSYLTNKPMSIVDARSGPKRDIMAYASPKDMWISDYHYWLLYQRMTNDAVPILDVPEGENYYKQHPTVPPDWTRSGNLEVYP